MTDLLDRTLQRIDELNALDPNTLTVDGRTHPKELVYAGWMSRWIEQLNPNASEALRIAARGIHVMRWTIPRDTYPAGTLGYHRWKNETRKFHADTVAGILRETGYDDATVDRVRALIGRQAAGDPEFLDLTDAVGLTFLAAQFEEFIEDWKPDMVIRALQGTWSRLSDKAQKIALDLPYSDRCREFLERALMGDDL